MNTAAVNTGQVPSFEIVRPECFTPLYTEHLVRDGAGRFWALLKFARAATPSAEEARRLLALINSLHGIALSRTIEHAWLDDGAVSVLMPKAEHACQYTLANDGERLQHALKVGHGLVSALQSAGMTHGRLVPENLVWEGSVLKVFGLGLHRALPANLWQGQERYVAPEVLHGETPTVASDVYSCAVIVAEILAGRPGARVSSVIRNVSRCAGDLGRVLRAATAMGPRKRPSLAVLAQALSPSRELASGSMAIPRAHTANLDTFRPLPMPDEVIELDPEEDSAVTELSESQFGRANAAIAKRPAALGFADEELDAPITRGFVPSKKAVLRSIPSKRNTPSQFFGQLGYYGRPSAHRRKYNLWGWGAAALITAGVIVAIFILSTRNNGDASSNRSVKVSPVGGPAEAISINRRAEESMSVTAVPAETKSSGVAFAVASPTRCPESMVRVGDSCIDRYEFPGKAKPPLVNVTQTTAENTCSKRGARLCHPEEWEAACRGPEGASWPYGNTYRTGFCNVDGESLHNSGSLLQCVSASGALDMSGNAGEWVSNGDIRGGSALDPGDGRCSRERRGRRATYSDVGFRCCITLESAN